MNKPLTLAAILLAGLSLTAHAATAAPAKDPIQARKHVFKEYKKSFGAMGDMVKGKTAWNKDEFAKYAANMETLSSQPWQYFPAGSDKGKPEARAEIWTKPAEFKKQADSHQAKIAELAKVAATATTLADVKPAFGAAGQTCKACHDQFKKD